MKLFVCLLALALMCLSSRVSAYTIDLLPGTTECFVIALDVDQPCSGSYEVITNSPDPIVVTVDGPDKNLHYSNVKSKGNEPTDDEEHSVDSGDSFEFDAVLEGDHTMCLHYDETKGENTDLKRTIAFNFRSTNAAPGFYKEYNGLDSELDALQRGLDTLKDHHAYMSQREDVHKTALDTINFKVLCWTILESVILVATAVWQISYIGSFFETKRRM